MTEPGAFDWSTLADAQGRVSGQALTQWAHERHLPLREAERACCLAGFLPARYARNAKTLTPGQQARLLESRVLLVGLGGLGGHVLDTLARLGVGQITGVDGDVFEESNANRQLLCDAHTYGQPKAQAAALYVGRVNPAVDFTPVPRFLQGEEFLPLAQEADVVVDALGGLAHREALHRAAAQAKKPVVSAGIAGLTGWMAVLHPEDTSPLPLLCGGRSDGSAPSSPSAEESLGNLAPTVAVAAALICSEILKLLTGQKKFPGLLCFDLSDHTFTPVRL